MSSAPLLLSMHPQEVLRFGLHVVISCCCTFPSHGRLCLLCMSFTARAHSKTQRGCKKIVVAMLMGALNGFALVTAFVVLFIPMLMTLNLPNPLWQIALSIFEVSLTVYLFRRH